MAIPEGIYRLRNVRTQHHTALLSPEDDVVACNGCDDRTEMWRIVPSHNRYYSIKHYTTHSYAGCEHRPRHSQYVRGTVNARLWTIKEFIDGAYTICTSDIGIYWRFKTDQANSNLILDYGPPNDYHLWTLEAVPGHPSSGGEPTHDDSNINLEEDMTEELEELFGRLPSVPSATYNSLARNSVTTCLKGTREDFLTEVHTWVENLDQSPVFWLNGLAGTGKTTIAQTIADHYGERGRLGASFFYSRDQQDRRDINQLFPTLASQLGDFAPSLRVMIAKAIKTDKMILRRNWKTQLRCLIFEPISAVKASFLSPIVVVLDALDECEEQETAAEIIRLLITKIHDTNLPIKFFVTSRPEIEIRSMFTSSQISPATRAVVLHEVSESTVQDDLQLYLRTALQNIALKNSDVITAGTWPTDKDIELLVRKAGKLFIYASTIVKFLEKSRHQAPDRLRMILAADVSAVRHSNPLAALDQLYSQILETALMAGPEEPDEVASLISRIVGTIVLLFARLSCQDLGRLLQLTELEVRGALVHLHSLLIVPRENDLPVQSFHASLHEYLTDNMRCTNHRLSIFPPQHHAMIARSCKERMRETLQELIQPVADPMHMVMTCSINSFPIPKDIQYSCQFWIYHLLQVGCPCPDDDLKRLTHDFITTKLLYWIAALNAVVGVKEQINVLKAVEGLDFIDSTSPAILTFRIGIVRLKLYQGIAFEDVWRKFEQREQKSPNKPTSHRRFPRRTGTDIHGLVQRITFFNDVVGSGSESEDSLGDDEEVSHPRRLRSGCRGSVLTPFHRYPR